MFISYSALLIFTIAHIRFRDERVKLASDARIPGSNLATIVPYSVGITHLSRTETGFEFFISI